MKGRRWSRKVGAGPGRLIKIKVNEKESIQPAPSLPSGVGGCWGYRKVGTAQVRQPQRPPSQGGKVGSPGGGHSWEFPGLDELAPRAAPPQRSHTAPRPPQQRPPTSLRGQRVRSSREGGCSSSERGARPRLFKSHLAKALAKHLPVPEGFPCEVCNVQTQPANPQRRVRGISRAADESGCDVREAESGGGGEDRVPAPASGRVQGSRIKPSSPGAGRGPRRARRRGGQLSIGASFLFRSRAGTAC